MYRAFFQLQDNPFSLTPDPDYLYLSASHREALAHLDYGVRERKGFIEIVGAPGTGKTTLCRLFLDRAEAKTRTAYIFNTFLTDVELLRAVNDEFGLPATGRDRKELTDALNRFLIDVAAEGGNAVLLIDEAQNLTLEALEQLRMLSNLETATEKLLQVVLVGQPELHARLCRPELAQLNERIAVRHRLEPLDAEECAAYVRHRLRVAGWRGLPQIEPAALAAVHRYSGGIPRRVNVICDRALLVAFSTGANRVGKAELRRAQEELGVLDAPPAAPSCPQKRRLPALPRRAPRWVAAGVLAALLGAGGWWWFAGLPWQEARAAHEDTLREGGVNSGRAADQRRVIKVDQSQRLALEHETGDGTSLK